MKKLFNNLYDERKVQDPIKNVTRGKTYTIQSVEGFGHEGCRFSFTDDTGTLQELADWLFEEV